MFVDEITMQNVQSSSVLDGKETFNKSVQVQEQVRR